MKTAQQIQEESQHTVNILLLAIVNDGNGSVCGMDYTTRCMNAEVGKIAGARRIAAGRWLDMAFNADLWHEANADDYTPATIMQLLATASAAASYYADHIKEGK